MWWRWHIFSPLVGVPQKQTVFGIHLNVDTENFLKPIHYCATVHYSPILVSRHIFLWSCRNNVTLYLLNAAKLLSSKYWKQIFAQLSWIDGKKSTGWWRLRGGFSYLKIRMNNSERHMSRVHVLVIWDTWEGSITTLILRGDTPPHDY